MIWTNPMPNARATVARGLLAVLLAVAAAAAGPVPGAAQDIRFLRIGTGATGGTYFPVGGLIANAVSNPPGSLPCEKGGSCGVPGVIAAAVSTQGSVENVTAVAAGTLDLALTQADIAFNAHFGRGAFAGQAPLTKLRAVAHLYPEAVHLVVRRDGGITSVADLKGKRVSVGEPESGTLVAARMVLDAFGMAESDLTVLYERVGKSGDMLAGGELDAYFMIGGYPMTAIAQLAETTDVGLVHIMGREADGIRRAHPFIGADIIPEGVYKGVGATVTLSVGAQLVVSAEADADLVYGITRALWHDNTRRLLVSSHPQGRQIELHKALDGVAIPLHPGAVRYYEEVGLIRASVH